MKQYLFVPWNNVFETKFFERESGSDLCADFKKRVKACWNGKATLFLRDKHSSRGLKLVYWAVNGEIFDAAGNEVS